MDSPGQDAESMTGMVAGGAQVVILTTGRGAPTGCAIAPLIKIAGNARTFRTMEDTIDIDASSLISDDASLQQVGDRILSQLVQVANGYVPKTETLGHLECGIQKLAPIHLSQLDSVANDQGKEDLEQFGINLGSRLDSAEAITK
jgi:altronate dehydratase large subunit